MNWEQVKNNVQILLGALSGFMVGKGWVDQSTATALIGVLMAVGPLIWGIIENTKAKMVAKVDSMDGVAGVLTKATTEGVALANSVPSPTVVPVGTASAAAVAKNGENHGMA